MSNTGVTNSLVTVIAGICISIITGLELMLKVSINTSIKLKSLRCLDISKKMCSFVATDTSENVISSHLTYPVVYLVSNSCFCNTYIHTTSMKLMYARFAET